LVPRLHIHALVAAWKLAGGEVGPEQINKQHGRVIYLTPSRLVVMVRPGRSPASGGGEVAAARPLRLGFGEGKGNVGQQAAVGGSLGPSGGAGLLGRQWKLAEGVLAVAATVMAAADGVLAHELQRQGYL
jgi:hypothetical protein